MSKRTGLKFNSQVIDTLTVVVLALVLVVVILTLVVFQNPYNAVNPFPPPTMPAAIQLPSATVTDKPALVLPSLQSTAVLPATAMPTEMPSPTITQTALPQPTQTETPSSAYRYQMQGSPVAITASIFNSDLVDCEWMGVAGQVHDMQDRPVTGILVLLGGRLEGENADQTTLTGTALNYGPAGYEFKLSDHVVASTGRLWIQLVDQSYIPLSAKVYFDTFAEESCGQNLIIINFRQVR